MVDHVRHSGIYQIDPYDTVTVVGAGGIGAITAITLAKMGFMNLRVFDAENVEGENIATQFHPATMLNKTKTHSLMWQIAGHDPRVIVETNGMVTPDTDIRANFIVSTVDSITSRKMVWEAAKNDVTWMYYLDARMGAEVFQLYTVYSREMGWYDQRINALNEDDIPELPCTEKATIYTAMGAAGMIGATLRKILHFEVVPKFQELNFANLTYYNSETYQKTGVPSLH